MTITIEDLFPNINTSLGNIGFLFGAGTSKDAGYPLTSELTRNILNKLSDDEKGIIEDLFIRKELEFSTDNGTLDIETITDIITEYRLSSGSEISSELQPIEKHIQNLIIEEIKGVNNPILKFHILFYKALKRLINDRYEPIWIFTPNYDILFELAAGKAEIPVNNCFEGIFKRYFSINTMDLVKGRITNIKSGFELFKMPCIKLIKLHGSISWFKEENQIFEENPYINERNPTIIHPRRRKLVDTLEQPFSHLFEYSSRILGRKCKYLVSCGFSFRDEHINERLLIPKLRERKIRIMALFNSEPEHIDELKAFKSFNYITRDSCYINGVEKSFGANIGIFNNLVKLFCEKSGLEVD